MLLLGVLYMTLVPGCADLTVLCRGGRIHTQWGCREVLYEETSQGAEATGLRMTKAGKEQIVEADVYVAALDVPGEPCLPIRLGGVPGFAAIAMAVLPHGAACICLALPALWHI